MRPATRLCAAALIAPIAIALLASNATAERPYAVTEKREPCSDFDSMRRPLFGDTHVHTTYSFDANGQDTRNTPRDAYRFAKGEKLGLQPYTLQGQATRHAQLRRPLDFTVVTDHAELLGEVRLCRNPELPGGDSDMCWAYRLSPQALFISFAMRNLIVKDRFQFCGENDALCLDQAGVVWKDIRAAAEEAYDRTSSCSFTSFVGYEWTASTGGGVNLHRNVIFRNERAPELPTSWIDTPSAYDLWTHLQKDCVDGIEGCDALTIPHNSNLSGPGLMFVSAKLATERDAELPVTKEEAKLRQRWEPLVEIMQHKGDSECLLGGDTTDEACGFEKLPYDSFAGVGRVAASGAIDPSLAADRRGMVREGLKKGLALHARLGENPLKYGIIASTDSHLGTPGLVAEADAKGHGGAGQRRRTGLPDDLEFNPGGLAVVWAEENSRDSIFAAMQRREAYGTSGTRPVVRFFGGWGYPDDMCEAQNFVGKGYASGVPMGSDLPEKSGDAPRFAVWALQDPGGKAVESMPLQRIQIVKGWIGENGTTNERVYDVAGGPNDAKVDPSSCDTSGEGSSLLCAVWEDPDFDDDEHAFYYARVLENPTCRWSQRLCVDAGVRCDAPESVPPEWAECCSERHVKTQQERAWTSPIWYSP